MITLVEQSPVVAPPVFAVWPCRAPVLTLVLTRRRTIAIADWYGRKQRTGAQRVRRAGVAQNVLRVEDALIGEALLRGCEHRLEPPIVAQKVEIPICDGKGNQCTAACCQGGLQHFKGAFFIVQE
jgi:hypothetical protein